MNRRDLLKGFISTTSYFFLGGIYRPPTSAVEIDRVSKIIRVRGFGDTINGAQLLHRLQLDFKPAIMPLRWAFPGWRLLAEHGWRIKTV